MTNITRSGAGFARESDLPKRPRGSASPVVTEAGRITTAALLDVIEAKRAAIAAEKGQASA